MQRRVSHPAVSECPSSQETISGAGRELSDVAGYTVWNRAMTDDPWNPFSSEDDFNLASWLGRSKVTKLQIDVYFAEGFGGTNSRSFQSTYTMRQHLNVLDPLVSTCCRQKPLSMMVDMKQLSIIGILSTVLAT